MATAPPFHNGQRQQSSTEEVGNTSELESFDDLLRAQQQEQQVDHREEDRTRRSRIPSEELLGVSAVDFRHVRRTSSGERTIRPDDDQSPRRGAGSVGENEESDGEVGLDGSVVTIRPSASDEASRVQVHVNFSPPKDRNLAERERPESRWNGFHLWRAESYQRRAVQQREEDEQTREEELRRRGSEWRPFQRTCSFLRAKFESIKAGHEDPMRLSSFKLAVLTIVLAGANVAWCLEYGYGTPYLLSLGMTKTSTSLVWLAAPLSGLVVQPLVGVLSDLSVSSFKRRQFIIVSSAVLAVSAFILAFSLPISNLLADILHAGMADWDPVRRQARDDINCFLSVLAFVLLDVSVNGVQVSARALIFDTTPSSLHAKATAWSARMMHAGNVFGYAAGWFNLSELSFLRWLGGDQFRKYSMVSLTAVIACSTLTCVCIDESKAQRPAVRVQSEDEALDFDTTAHTVASAFLSQPVDVPVSERIQEALMHVWQTFRRLPRSVRRVCFVQLFANMAWFPFLFYATEWVIEVWMAEQDKGGKAIKGNRQERAERLGSFALLLFAGTSLASAIILPYFALANWRPSKRSTPDLDGQSSSSSSDDGDDDENDVGGETSLLLQQRRAKHTPTPPRWRIPLRTFWSIAMSVYFVQTCILTFVASRSSMHAIALVASIGVPYAVAVWVPYALVMESVREAEEGLSPFEFEGDWFSPRRVMARRRQALRNGEREGRMNGGGGDQGIREDEADRSTLGGSPIPTTSLGRARARVRAARALQDCAPLVDEGERRSAKQALKKPSSVLTRGVTMFRTTGAGGTERSASVENGIDGSMGIRQSSEVRSSSEDSVGATILGIHNMAIVVPQMLTALLVALLLRRRSNDGTALALSSAAAAAEGDVSVVWVLRFGGLAALCAAVLTRFVPLSQTERRMLRDPATLRQIAWAKAAPRLFDDEASETSSEAGGEAV